MLDPKYKNLRIVSTFVGTNYELLLLKRMTKKPFSLWFWKPISFFSLWLVLNMWQKEQVMKTLTLTF